jgi:uncharacterized membrane protein
MAELMVSWGLMRFRWAISGNAVARITAIMSVDFNLFMVFLMVLLVDYG